MLDTLSSEVRTDAETEPAGVDIPSDTGELRGLVGEPINVGTGSSTFVGTVDAAVGETDVTD